MMSPEPTQEPIEENLKAPDLNVGATAINESDSEDEEPGLGGYMPLSQVPLDSDPMLDEDEVSEIDNLSDLSMEFHSCNYSRRADDQNGQDEDWISAPIDSNYMLSSVSGRNDQVQACPSDTLEVWSLRSNQSDIDLDADKINQVKTAMASFILPNAAIPEWANSVSEEEWKQILIERIKEMQSKDN